jgi:hypothetical protein
MSALKTEKRLAMRVKHTSAVLTVAAGHRRRSRLPVAVWPTNLSYLMNTV